MSAPLSRKWNSNLYNILSHFVLFQVKRNARRSKKVPDAGTMPDLAATARARPITSSSIDSVVLILF